MLVSALGIEYVMKDNAPQKVTSKVKKTKVFEEYQDHNDHFHSLTRDMTPVSVESNICMKCRTNVINTVRKL